MDLISLATGLVIGAIIAAVLTWAMVTARTSSRIRDLTADLAAAEAHTLGVSAQLERADAAAAEEREASRAQVESMRERERTDARVLTALSPVQRQLDALQRTVADIEAQRAAQQGELGEQLRRQHDAGERLRATTDALGAALNANQTRGTWGEAQLRNVLESSGMLERVDFDIQRTIAGETGRGRPDCVVALPGGKHLVVDAKAPLTKYLAAQQLSDTGDDDERARRSSLLGEHASALRAHVRALASRDYPSGVAGSPELVIAFVPSESALSAALAADAALLDDAFALGVALTSPVSLWATMRAVAHAWRQDELSGSAREMFELGRTLYTRLSTTAGHLDRLGRSLTATVGHFNGLVGSIETRVLPAARRLGELDAREPLRIPPPLDDAARALSAPELTAAVELAYPTVNERDGEGGASIA